MFRAILVRFYLDERGVPDERGVQHPLRGAFFEEWKKSETPQGVRGTDKRKAGGHSRKKKKFKGTAG